MLTCPTCLQPKPSADYLTLGAFHDTCEDCRRKDQAARALFQAAFGVTGAQVPGVYLPQSRKSNGGIVVCRCGKYWVYAGRLWA